MLKYISCNQQVRLAYINNGDVCLKARMRVVTKSGSNVRMSDDEEESERFFTLFKDS